MVRTFAVIGDPIDHSLSPAMHNAAFLEARMDCTYIAYRVPRGEVPEGLDSLRAAGIEGFNVTIPHKVAVMEHLDSVSEECSLIGAANLVHDRGGRRRGFNTDMEGFLGPLLSRNVPLPGCRVLLLGAGGAARAGASGLAARGASHIHICNRNVEKARSLAEHCSRMGVSSSSGPLPSYVEAGFDLVVNATSVGMNGGPSPADMGRVSPGVVAYDMVYRPVRTSFLEQAEDAGAVIIPGWEMLLHQAALSFSILHDREAPVQTMKRALVGVFE
ncbi:MAG: shikimate dehydrogenase [Nitrosopumilaceae archaeon]|nr:shikimate dehydrogenase [Nitrosopumilaceae archaeon]